MKKLLKLLDNNLLRFGVAFAILFTTLYPKLPSISINHTWVYIRLEDFVILALVLLWFVQLLRKKVFLPRPEGYALIGYWVVGLVSLLYSLAVIAPHLANFFPQIAALQYFRRIEYMILFFIAFSTIKNIKDVYFYIAALCVTVFGIVLYGFGQRFYFLLWNAFPDFFQKNPFCFPAFLTGNEEFAKGIPLCLNDTSRITSTFGGHYDLSAYLVLVIPILIGLAFALKRWYFKVLVIVLAMLSLELLNFTSSRTSFAAYVIGVTAMLVLWQKKRWIVPILAVSLGLMLLFSNSTIQRFSKTIQQVQVVSVKEQLPSDLQKIITDAKTAEDVKAPEVPPASDFTVGAQQPIASLSGYSTVLTDEQLKRLQSGDVAISTVSGSFLIKKAYALDISFTTRFQGEWPRNWKAFLSSPVFGTGYSSLTLATDNDYLRALGETGLLGLLSFLFIFVILGIFMKRSIASVKDNVTKGFLYGLSGGVIGLLINAILIDVFEASKVAEPLWILLGVGVGAAKLYHPQKIAYKKALTAMFTSRILLYCYFFLVVLIAYAGSVGNFFVGTDFMTLRWAASAIPSDVLAAFMQFQVPAYQPLSSALLYFMYMLFSFQPEGYHWVVLLLHFLTVIIFYQIVVQITKHKLVGFLSAALFAVLPMHTETLYWISNFSVVFGTFLSMLSVLMFVLFRTKKQLVFYIASMLIAILAFIAHPSALLILFAVILLAMVLPKEKHSSVIFLIPYIILSLGYLLLKTYSGNVTHLFSHQWLYFVSTLGSLVFVWLLSLIISKVTKRAMMQGLILAIIVLVTVVFSVSQTIQEQARWKIAGDITKKALAYIRIAHPNFPPDANLYFVNVPQKKNNIPVFENGLLDSLWFIYRADMPRVMQLSKNSMFENTINPENNYIFKFKDGVLSETK